MIEVIVPLNSIKDLGALIELRLSESHLFEDIEKDNVTYTFGIRQ